MTSAFAPGPLGGWLEGLQNLQLIFFLVVWVDALLWLWATDDSGKANQKSTWTAKSVLERFRESFDTPESLVKGMAKNNCFLSGSRASDFFIPGSTSPDSGWDLYIPNHHDCIAGALLTLSRCGVIWEDSLSPYRKLIKSEDEATVHISLDKDKELIRHRGAKYDANLIPLFTAVSSAVNELADKDNEAVQVIKVNKASIHVHAKYSEIATGLPSTGERDTGYGPTLNVVRGHTTFNGTSHTVQLISSADKTPIDLIFAFYASRVRCFVSAFGAAHFYLRRTRRQRCGHSTCSTALAPAPP